jgi:hypothetical protein
MQGNNMGGNYNGMQGGNQGYDAMQGNNMGGNYGSNMGGNYNQGYGNQGGY